MNHSDGWLEAVTSVRFLVDDRLEVVWPAPIEAYVVTDRDMKTLYALDYTEEGVRLAAKEAGLPVEVMLVPLPVTKMVFVRQL